MKMPSSGSAGASAGPPSATAQPQDVRAATAPNGEDEAFITSLKAGDAAAFTELYRRYHGSMSRVAAGYVGSTAVVEEVVQETWMAVLEGVARFQQRSSLRTWLFAILVNRAKTRGQREHRMLPFSALGNQTDEQPEPAQIHSATNLPARWSATGSASADVSPEKLAMRAQVAALLEEAMDKLPDNYRIVITMRDIEGLESADVCAILGISLENQRVLLHRARARLRTLLGPLLDAI